MHQVTIIVQPQNTQVRQRVQSFHFGDFVAVPFDINQSSATQKKKYEKL